MLKEVHNNKITILGRKISKAYNYFLIIIYALMISLVLFAINYKYYSQTAIKAIHKNKIFNFYVTENMLTKLKNSELYISNEKYECEIVNISEPILNNTEVLYEIGMKVNKEALDNEVVELTFLGPAESLLSKFKKLIKKGIINE